MSLLGIDIGTSGAKTAALSEDGRALASAYREYPTLHPREGWAELDSRRVFSAVKETIAEVVAQLQADPPTALCVGSMGEAMTPVTADRRILGNCILGADVRGAEHADRLAREMGQEAFYAINPNILAPNYSLPKLLWLREHEPELFEGAWKFLLWGDLAGYLLGGEPVTSHSHANRTLLYDIRREDWSEPLLTWAGVERAKLPKPVASGTVAGTVSDPVAAELGLPRGVKIVVGGHDQCMNSLGAGVCSAGRATCGIGTVECIMPTYDHIPAAGPMLSAGLNVEHHAVAGLYGSFLYNQSGVLVRWFRDTFARGEARALQPGQDIYDVLAAEMPAEPTRLLVLPHFEITGSPHFIADSAGAIVGLRTSTTRGEILKAIMESVTFYFLESLDDLRAMGIDTSEFVATGGGAKSDAWLQIKADILGANLVRPRQTECGTLGGAILAGLATGVYSSPAEGVAAMVSRERVFEPDPARHSLYRERFGRYRELYPSLRGLLKSL